MTSGQFVFGIYFALVSAYLSIVLHRLLRQNGRVLDRMDEGFRKMDEGVKLIGEKIDEGFKKMDERTAIIAQMLKKMDERTAKISEQIVIVPQKTAMLIKEKGTEYSTEK